MKLFFKCWHLIFFAHLLVAQQDAQFSQYMFNKLYFNPAQAGLHDTPQFSFLHRSQWLGYEPTNYQGGSPTTQLFTISSPITSINSGIGLTLVNDKIGPIRNTYGTISYAYHFKLGQNRLSFGLAGGLYSFNIDPSQYRYNDQGDKNIPVSSVSQAKPDFNGGVNFSNKKYYIGLSASHLNQSKFDYSVNATQKGSNSLSIHYFITGGYAINLNENLLINTSFILKSQRFNKESSVELSGIATFREKYWAGLAYRLQDAAVLLVGINLLENKSLKLGYAFDFTVTGKQAKASSSHEIMLAYALPALNRAIKPIIRTPRYRF